MDQKNAMVKWRQGVIYGQWRIHESDFLKIEITVPSVEEQRKIGAYLDQLDNLITLHQRECISFTARAGRLILTANKKRNTSSSGSGILPIFDFLSHSAILLI